MSSKDRKRGLGRGLSALMSDVTDAEMQSGTAQDVADRQISIERIKPNPDQPRKRFEQEELDDLTASINEKGIIQPLIVRRVGEDFEIVAGERRWRAAQQAQLHEVPVIVRDFDDTEVLEIAIIENIQRADLNPIEEAAGYRQLMDRFGHTQEKLGEALGKSRSHIANLLRLLQLPSDVQNLVLDGRLSGGHARALVTAENPSELARKVVKQGLSVRATEALVRKEHSDTGTATPKSTKVKTKDADTRALEDDLSAALGLKAVLTYKPGEEQGALTLHYKSLEQLDDLCRKLSSG